MRLPARGFSALLLLRVFKRPFRVFFLTLAIMPLVATLLFNTIRLPASFSVSADTEILDMIVTEQVGTTRWYVRDALATFGLDDPVDTHNFQNMGELLNASEPQPEPFRGFVDIGSCMRVRMVRYGSGPLSVIIEPVAMDRTDAACSSSENDASAAHLQVENLLTPAQTSQPLRSIALEINVVSHPFSGGFQGVGHIGVETYDTNAALAPPMLHQGHVTALGTALLTGDRFEVMRLPLELGDEVHVINQDGRDARTACVFSAGENQAPGFAVSCRARGSALQVSRLGTRALELRPTLWAYLKGDPVFQSLLALIGFALMIFFEYVPGRVLAPPRNVRPSLDDNASQRADAISESPPDER
ncbi:hypothetical protein [Halomonas sp. WWR20]